MRKFLEWLGKQNESSSRRMMTFFVLQQLFSDHRGIVYTSQENTVGEIIRGLMLIYQVLAAEEMVGHVEYL